MSDLKELSEERRKEIRQAAERIDAEKPEMQRLADRSLIQRLAEELKHLIDLTEAGKRPENDRLQLSKDLANRALEYCRRS